MKTFLRPAAHFAIAVLIFHSSLPFSSQLLAQTLLPDPQNINCKVTYGPVSSSSPGASFSTTSYVSIKPADLTSLPSNAPSFSAPNGTKELALPHQSDFDGSLAIPRETKNGKTITTYDGNFKNLVVEERFWPVGDVILLTPENSQFDSTGKLEFSMIMLPDKNLSAVWSRPSSADGKGTIAGRYFSVAVQVYQRQHAIRRAEFSGTQSVQTSSSSTTFGPNWTTSWSTGSGMSSGMKMTMSDTTISLNDTPWVDDDDYVIKCVAIKLKE